MAGKRRLVPKAELVDIAPPEATQAQFIAFYALHDTLVAQGVIPAGAVADTLARFECDDVKLGGFIAEILKNLREMPFRPQTVRDTLRVVEGGPGESGGYFHC